ncbi:MAG: hypothetical protein RLZZ370_921, partial [Bacteroidota bacterium]
YTAAASSPDNLPFSINWDFGDGGNAGGSRVNYRYKKSGSYNIRQIVTTQYCQRILVKSMTALPEVSADFLSQNLNRERLRFSALDTMIPGYRYDWSSGDGFTGQGREWAHTYEQNGTFPVRLVVDNQQGCADTSEVDFVLSSPNLKPQDNVLDFYLYPNPTNESFTYKFRLSQADDVRVELFDILGQDPIWSRTWRQAPAGTSYEELNLKRLGISGGTYVLRLRSGTVSAQVKLVFTP